MQIAGQNIANPTAALLSTAMLLRHCNLPDFSDRCLNLSLLSVLDEIMPTPFFGA